MEIIDAPAEAAQTAIKEYSPTESALATLRQRFGGIAWDCTTTKGDKDARAARLELVRLRTSLEAKRKELKAPALEYSRRIDSEAQRITGQILALEGPVDEAIRAEEQRKEAEKQERIAAEQRRVAALQKRIADIRAILTDAASAPSADHILVHVQMVESLAVGEDFEEFQPVAEAAKAETLQQLRKLHAAAVEREAEAARLAAERAELARLRAEDETRRAAQAKADAEARAAEEARARAEREAAAAEQRRLDAEAEAARYAADVKAAAERAEADRIAREARAVEERRIAAERAELQRQQDEARARELAEKAEAERKRAQIFDTADQMLAVLVQWRDADECKTKGEREAATAAARVQRDIAIAAALA